MTNRVAHYIIEFKALAREPLLKEKAQVQLTSSKLLVLFKSNNIFSGRHDTQHSDFQHNDTEHNGIQHKELICDTQHK
jgi:hypothetical protein